MGTKGDAVGSVNNCNSCQILCDIMDWDHLLYETFLVGKPQKNEQICHFFLVGHF